MPTVFHLLELLFFLGYFDLQVLDGSTAFMQRVGRCFKRLLGRVELRQSRIVTAEIDVKLRLSQIHTRSRLVDSLAQLHQLLLFGLEKMEEERCRKLKDGQRKVGKVCKIRHTSLSCCNPLVSSLRVSITSFSLSSSLTFCFSISSLRAVASAMAFSLLAGTPRTSSSWQMHQTENVQNRARHWTPQTCLLLATCRGPQHTLMKYKYVISKRLWRLEQVSCVSSQVCWHNWEIWMWWVWATNEQNCAPQRPAYPWQTFPERHDMVLRREWWKIPTFTRKVSTLASKTMFQYVS